MKIFQPIIKKSGELPLIFQKLFASFVGFTSYDECESWIDFNTYNFTENEIGGGIFPQEFEVENPTIIDYQGMTLYQVSELPFQQTMTKISNLNTELRKQCVEFLTKVVNEKGGDMEVTDPNEYETVCVSYDGGSHPEYNSNCFSEVKRVFFKNDEIYLEIDDCDDYSIDRVITSELAEVCDFIVRYNLCNHSEND